MSKQMPRMISPPEPDARPKVGPGFVHPHVRRSPGPLTRRVAQISASATTEVLRPFDLNRIEYTVLTFAFWEPGLDQSRIAAMATHDPTSVGMAIDSLEARALIVRRMADHDRRLRALYLTQKGEKLFTRLRPLVVCANQAILSVLSKEEREKFFDFMVRIIEANPQHDRPGADRRARSSKTSAGNK